MQETIRISNYDPHCHKILANGKPVKVLSEKDMGDGRFEIVCETRFVEGDSMKEFFDPVYSIKEK